MTEDAKLAACPSPWCPSRREQGCAPFVRYHESACDYQVRCDVCPMGGPIRITEAEAIAAWSSRTPDPRIAAAEAALATAKKAFGIIYDKLCAYEGSWPTRDARQAKSDFHAALSTPRQPDPFVRRAEVRAEALEEALTPSGETKAAYHGEFAFSLYCGVDDEGDDMHRQVYVPWDTVKAIMAAIKARADRRSVLKDTPHDR